jgi:1-acyl-sn-glycerol-3-phosphate acyltransferase
MLASNHASYLDPVVIGDGCPRPCHFLAREDLFEIPGIRGWLISRLHTHGIKRDSADRRALQKSRKVLDGGHVLVSFPEGKRTRDGELMPAKPGIGWIALNSNCAVVPTYVQGAFEAWPRHEKKFKWTKVRVFYGKPLYFEDLKKKIRFSKEDYEDASNRIMDQIKHLKKVAPPLTKES